MFSHEFDSSFNLVENYEVVPFGYRCHSAMICTNAKLRKHSLPFDWVIPLTPKKIINILENDFVDFIPNDISNNISYGEDGAPILKTKYGIQLAHFNKNIDEGVNEYMRRIERFRSIMKENKKKYFIFINQDYLNELRFRNEIFNKEKYKEMLELSEYLKKKYKEMDFCILYFDFVKHEKVNNSNIIQIVFSTDKYYLTEKESSAIEFRKYCAEVLSQMFTPLRN
jgi:hypothetical protein